MVGKGRVFPLRGWRGKGGVAFRVDRLPQALANARQGRGFTLIEVWSVDLQWSQVAAVRQATMPNAAEGFDRTATGRRGLSFKVEVRCPWVPCPARTKVKMEMEMCKRPGSACPSRSLSPQPCCLYCQRRSAIKVDQTLSLRVSQSVSGTDRQEWLCF